MFSLSLFKEQFNHQRLTSFSACTTQPPPPPTHTDTHLRTATLCFFLIHLLFKTALCDVSVYQWVWLAACGELFRPYSLRQAGRLLFVNASTLLCLSVCLSCATHRNIRQYDNAGLKIPHSPQSDVLKRSRIYWKCSDWCRFKQMSTESQLQFKINGRRFFILRQNIVNMKSL